MVIYSFEYQKKSMHPIFRGVHSTTNINIPNVSVWEHPDMESQSICSAMTTLRAHAPL